MRAHVFLLRVDDEKGGFRWSGDLSGKRSLKLAGRGGGGGRF